MQLEQMNQSQLLKYAKNLQDELHQFHELVDRQSGTSDYLQSVYNGTDIAIFVIDVLPKNEFRYAGVNPKHEEISGMTNDFIHGKSPEELVPQIPEEAVEPIKQHYFTCVERKEMIEYEEMIPMNGKDIWWLTRLTPLLDADKKVYRIIGTSKDITNQKQVEKDLKKAKDQLQKVITEKSFMLQERIKEIECIYSISELGRKEKDVTKILKKITELIPPGWKEPENTCVQVKYFNKIFQTDNFKETTWQLKTPLHQQDDIIGELIIGYTNISEEDPFLAEEKELTEKIAEIVSEITHRKKNEIIIADNETMYRTFLNNFQGIAFQSTIDWKPIFFQGAVKEITGYEENEFLQKEISWDQIIHPEDLSALQQQHQYEIQNQEDFSIEREYRIHHRNGSVRWVQDYIRTVRDAKDNKLILQGTIHDITNLKTIQQSMQTERSRSESFIESMPGVFYQISKDMKFVHWNKNFEVISGYNADEFAQLNPLDLFEGEEKERIQEAIIKAFETGYADVDAHLRTKDGKKIPFLFNGNSQIINNETYLVGLGIDISERNKITRELDEERAQLLSVFDGIEDVIYVADTETHELLFLNTAAKRYWGDGVGKKCYEILQNRASPCPFCTNDKILANRDEAYVWEFQNEITKHWFRCSDKVIRWSDGRLVRFEIAADITMSKEAQKEIESIAKFPEENPNPVMRFNTEGNMIYSNQGAQVLKQYWELEKEKTAPEELKKKIEKVLKNNKEEVFVINIEKSTYEVKLTPISTYQYVNLYAVDVTGQLQAEKKLISNEKKFRDIFDNATDSMIIIDFNGEIKEVNKRACENYGYSKEEFLSIAPLQLIHPDYHYKFKEFMESLQKIGSYQGETIDRRKNGTTFHTSVKGSIVQIDGENHVMAVVRDITEEKQMQILVEESEERLNLATEAAEIGIWDWKVDSNTVFYSDIWKKQVGYLPNELNNEFVTWEKLLHPDDYDNMMKAVNDYLANPEGAFNVKFRFKHKDGSYRWIQNHANSYKDDSGKVIRMLGAHIDVTENTLAQKEVEKINWKLQEQLEENAAIEEELRATNETLENEVDIRKKAEEKTKETYQILLSMFNAITESASLIEPDGKILMANETFIKTMKADAKTIVGKNLSSFLPKQIADNRQKIINKVVKTGKPETFQDQQFGRYILNSFYPVHNSEGRIIYIALFGFDVTEQREAQKKILESEERFRRLAENAQDMIYRMSLPDGVYEYVSPASKKIWGYSPQEVLAQPNLIKKCIHPDFKDYLTKQMKELVKGNMPSSYEYKIITKKGEEKWLYQRNVLVKDKNKKPIAIEGIVTDITDRVQAQERFEKIFKLSSDLICVADINGFFRMLNPAWEKILGYTVEELMGKPFIDFIHPDDKEPTLAVIKEKLAKGETVLRFENRYLTKKGEALWLEWTSQPNIIEGITFAMARDVTEKKQSIQNLKEQEERFRSLFEAEPDAILTADPLTGTILQVNSAAEKLFKKPAEELIGINQKLLHPPEMQDDIVEKFKEIALNGSTEPQQIVIQDGEGKIIPVEVVGNVTELQGKPLAIGIFRDITERKKAEEMIFKEKRISESTIDGLPGIFYQINTKGNYVRWNKKFLEVTGKTDEEMKTINAIEFFTGDDQNKIAEAMKNVFTVGETEVEADLIVSNGEKIPYLFTGKLFTIENEPFIIGMGLDVSEIKKIEKKLRKSVKEMESFNKLAVGREHRMIELKRTINALNSELGKDEPYDLSFADDLNEPVE